MLEEWNGGEMEWWRIGMVEDWNGGMLLASPYYTRRARRWSPDLAAKRTVSLPSIGPVRGQETGAQRVSRVSQFTQHTIAKLQLNHVCLN